MKNLDKIKLKLVDISTLKIIDTVFVKSIPTNGDIICLDAGNYVASNAVHSKKYILLYIETVEAHQARQKKEALNGSTDSKK